MIEVAVKGVVRGMTASFMPLCLVSIAIDALMHEHLLMAESFGVSILPKGKRRQAVISLAAAIMTRA